MSALRYGPAGAWPAINTIAHTVESVKLYCGKLKVGLLIHGSRVTRVLVQEFLDDVAAVGLQQQYEAVTENLGLIAQLIQCEHAAADADTGLR